ncbi:DUF4270 domain-containing protein [Flavobacterium limnophilum]|uniref:DUF4270 domain-containing protein n=1 Tax=Flavobacterium limnophilum TaxID=3003262 RepID=UPI002482567D|nr:DUF4270 domain-containing protein [Flavobacterium limnophilum]
MRNNSIFKQILLVASIVLFVSCDKDYNVIGDGLIGENHFTLKDSTFSVVAYNEKITPIQSNNLPINALGIYDNPAFGKTTANFATQLILAAEDPVIGANPVIDSVYIEVPYFVDATQTKALTAGGNSYVLDSIYGKSLAKIKLSIFESGLYMRDKDPVGGFQEAQKYFTDQNTDFENLKKGTRLNDDANKAQNDEFFYNPAQRNLTTTDAAGKKTNVYSTPAMRLKLNSQFFTDKIINAPAGKLTTNEIFKEYFKGLYFKVEQSGTDPGSLAMINFTKGTITINYKEDLSTTVGTVVTVTRVPKSIVLNLSGNQKDKVNTVSLLEQSNTNANYSNATGNPDRVLGDEKLYLKGGEGSLAVIELFDKTDLIGYDKDGNLTGPNGVSDQLDIIRKKGWLINQASLLFNIDASSMANSYEPERVYLYDFTNSRITLDYYSYSGKITRDATSQKRGVSYKVNLTNHIRSLVKHKDSTNIKLGIVVTENIEIPDFYKLRTPTAFLSKAPKASVMNPLGTVLYGGKSSVPDSKRLKLEIYYTKPN